MWQEESYPKMDKCMNLLILLVDSIVSDIFIYIVPKLHSFAQQARLENQRFVEIEVVKGCLGHRGPI